MSLTCSPPPRPTEPRPVGPLSQLLVSGGFLGRPRRVIAKIEHHLGELFPRMGFIVTTLTGPNRAVVRFYNQRGTAEQWIKAKTLRQALDAGDQLVEPRRLLHEQSRDETEAILQALIEISFGAHWCLRCAGNNGASIPSRSCAAVIAVTSPREVCSHLPRSRKRRHPCATAPFQRPHSQTGPRQLWRRKVVPVTATSRSVRQAPSRERPATSVSPRTAWA
jgi:Transposase DDE domain group 1